MTRSRLALIVATIAVVVAWVLSPSSGRAQSLADAKLTEAKQLAGSVLRALQQCVQAKGAGASCVLSEVSSTAGVDPTTGATRDGRWIVGPDATLALSTGAAPVTTGAITVRGGSGRDTSGLALSLDVTRTGSRFRCETRTGVPPGPGAGSPC